MASDLLTLSEKSGIPVAELLKSAGSGRPYSGILKNLAGNKKLAAMLSLLNEQQALSVLRRVTDGLRSGTANTRAA